MQSNQEGKLLSKDKDKLPRWVEHSQEVLNHPGLMTVQEDPENPVDPLPIYVGDFTEAEVQGLMKHMKNHKAPGNDKIAVEIMKPEDEYITSWLTRKCNQAWNSTDT